MISLWKTILGHAIADRGVQRIALINGIAALRHFVFWIFLLLRLPSSRHVETEAERIDLAVTYGLGVADLLWSVSLLTIGSVWLYQGNAVGWLAAQIVNGFYWYSFTFIAVRELNAKAIRPATLLFLPFAIFSFWAAWYLWQVRPLFM